ncbi:MAG: TIM barrel protein [Steroidobacteraceae bacterium]
MYTRREFGLLALSGMAAPSLGFAQKVAGVQLGVQTYSFRELPRAPGGDQTDAIVAAMKECGLTECELWSPMIEPASPIVGRRPTPEEGQKVREDLRRWRIETPLSYFQGIRKKFQSAGLSIPAYNYSFAENFTDAEIERGFEMAKALGATYITASSTLKVAPRVAPFAEKHQMLVAMHNHSAVDNPNEFASIASLEAALAMSKQFRINLDIGHFTAGNNDPVAFLRARHALITNLHIKDRKKNQGDNTPWGTGDTPIREVLQLLKREKWPIAAYIEYEHRGEGTPVAEVRKCLDHARQALA